MVWQPEGGEAQWGAQVLTGLWYLAWGSPKSWTGDRPAVCLEHDVLSLLVRQCWAVSQTPLSLPSRQVHFVPTKACLRKTPAIIKELYCLPASHLNAGMRHPVALFDQLEYRVI